MKIKKIVKKTLDSNQSSDVDKAVKKESQLPKSTAFPEDSEEEIAEEDETDKEERKLAQEEVVTESLQRAKKAKKAKVDPYSTLEDLTVIEIIDYVIQRVGDDRTAKIGEKAKEAYEAMLDHFTEEEAQQVIELGSTKVVEAKLLAIRR